MQITASFIDLLIGVISRGAVLSSVFYIVGNF